MSETGSGSSEVPGNNNFRGITISTDSESVPISPGRLGLVMVTPRGPPSYAGLDTGRKRTLKKAQMYCPEVLRGYSADCKAQLMVVKKNWLEVADQKHRSDID